MRSGVFTMPAPRRLLSAGAAYGAQPPVRRRRAWAAEAASAPHARQRGGSGSTRRRRGCCIAHTCAKVTTCRWSPCRPAPPIPPRPGLSASAASPALTTSSSPPPPRGRRHRWRCRECQRVLHFAGGGQNRRCFPFGNSWSTVMPVHSAHSTVFFFSTSSSLSANRTRRPRRDCRGSQSVAGTSPVRAQRSSVLYRRCSNFAAQRMVSIRAWFSVRTTSTASAAPRPSSSLSWPQARHCPRH